ncbi:kinesin-like protein [Savitreella phatthalungensis]
MTPHATTSRLHNGSGGSYSSIVGSVQAQTTQDSTGVQASSENPFKYSKHAMMQVWAMMNSTGSGSSTASHSVNAGTSTHHATSNPSQLSGNFSGHGTAATSALSGVNGIADARKQHVALDFERYDQIMAPSPVQPVNAKPLSDQERKLLAGNINSEPKPRRGEGNADTGGGTGGNRRSGKEGRAPRVPTDSASAGTTGPVSASTPTPAGATSSTHTKSARSRYVEAPTEDQAKTPAVEAKQETAAQATLSTPERATEAPKPSSASPVVATAATRSTTSVRESPREPFSTLSSAGRSTSRLASLGVFDQQRTSSPWRDNNDEETTKAATAATSGLPRPPANSASVAAANTAAADASPVARLTDMYQAQSLEHTSAGNDSDNSTLGRANQAQSRFVEQAYNPLSTGLPDLFGTHKSTVGSAGSPFSHVPSARSAFIDTTSSTSPPIGNNSQNGSSTTPGSRQDIGSGQQSSAQQPAQQQQQQQQHQPQQMARVMVMPDKLKWMYRDPTGQNQGPFSGLEMHDWYKAGFFQPNLLVKREEDEDFEPLSILVRRIGNQREPFLVPLPSRVPVSQVPGDGRASSAGNAFNNGSASENNGWGSSSGGAANWGTGQPPFPQSFPSFGTTLTAEQQNALERRKQEEQYLMHRQREFLQQQMAQQMASQRMPQHGGLSGYGIGPGMYGGFNNPLGGTAGAYGVGLGPYGAYGQPQYGRPQQQSYGGGSPYERSSSGMGFAPPAPSSGAFGESDAWHQQQQPPMPAQHQQQPFQTQHHQQPQQQQQHHQHQQQQQQQQLGSRSVAPQQDFGAGIFDNPSSETPEHSARGASAAFADSKHSPWVPVSVEPSSILDQALEPEEAVGEEKEQPAQLAQAPVEGPVQDERLRSPIDTPAQPEVNAAQAVKPTAKEQTADIEVVSKHLDNVALAEYIGEQAAVTPSTPTSSAVPAPWAKATSEKGKSLKEIQDLEAQQAAHRRRLEKQAAEQLRAQQASLAAASQSATPAEAVLNLTWAEKNLDVSSPGASPATGAPWKAAGAASGKKTLAQIQLEEEKAAKARAAQQAAQTRAATASLPASMQQSITTGSRYADSVARSSGTANIDSSWATVGAGGRVVTPVATRQAPSIPTNAPRPVMAKTISTVSVPARQQTTAAASAAAATPSDPNAISAEFYNWAHSSLKGLNAGVDFEGFLQLLLSFGTDAGKETQEIISDSVYANSRTLDGRRFAQEWVRRRRDDLRNGDGQNKTVSEHTAAAAAASASGATGGAASDTMGGWNSIVKSNPAPQQDEWSTSIKVKPSRKSRK